MLRIIRFLLTRNFHFDEGLGDTASPPTMLHFLGPPTPFTDP